MAATERSPGRRFVPAGLKDPRLIVGIALVVLSVLGVVLLVQSLERTQPVYAAARDLGTGETLTEADLKVVQVRLGEAAEGYLSAEQPPETGLRTQTALRAGELVPVRALGRDGDHRRPVALRLEGPPPPGVRVGSLVDVYSSTQGPAAATPEPPRLVLEGLEVLAVAEAEGGLGSGLVTEVQLLVPPEQVQVAVEARAADRLDLVAAAAP